MHEQGHCHTRVERRLDSTRSVKPVRSIQFHVVTLTRPLQKLPKLGPGRLELKGNFFCVKRMYASVGTMNEPTYDHYK